MSSEIMQALAGMNKQAADADANQGLGSIGWWPPEGPPHNCFVLPDVQMEQGKFAYRIGQERKEIPCTVIRFSYGLVDDPGQEEPRTFKGREFQLLTDDQVAALPEGPREQGGKQQTRARIEAERFKGHLTTILGEEPSNFQTGLQQVLEKLEAAEAKGGVVQVKVRLDYTDRKRSDGSTYRVPDREYLQPV
jgi:hypothetical protein